MNRLLTTVLLAAPQPGDYDPSTGKGPEWGKAAPIGLLVILLLAVALYFLLRSFTRQLKKVPASFDPPADPDGGADLDADAAPSPTHAARVPAAPAESDDPPHPAEQVPTRPVNPPA